MNPEREHAKHIRPLQGSDLVPLQRLFGGNGADIIVGEGGSNWHHMVDSLVAGNTTYFVLEEEKHVVGVGGMVYASEAARKAAKGPVAELAIFSFEGPKKAELEAALLAQGKKQAKAHGYTNVFYRGEIFVI